MKLSGKLPDWENNGLSAMEGRMARQPEEQHVIVAVVDVHRTTKDWDTGDIEVTTRVRHVEVMRDEQAEEKARHLLEQAHARRTGLVPLPLADPDTGEVAG